MTTIAKDSDVLTVVVYFEVEPANQQPLLNAIGEMIEQFTSKQPGLASTHIHSSEDGTRVLNYAQWESREHYEAFRNNPDGRPFAERLEVLGKPESHVFDVAIAAEP